MKYSTLIVWLLVAACIAIDLAMIGELQLRRNEWPEAGGVVGLGLTFSQVALIALWAVCGRSNVLIRGVSSLLAIWAISCLASYSADGRLDDSNNWFGILMFYCSVCLIPFIIVRCAGYAIANRKSSQQQQQNHPLSTRQYSIWGILSLMTAIGIALAVVRFAEFPMEDLVGVISLFSILAFTTCTVVLLGLFLSRVRYAIIATIVICPIASILVSLTELGEGKGLLEFALMMYVQGVSSLSATAVLRSAGYLGVQHGKLSRVTASESSDVSDPPAESSFAEP